MMKIKYTNKFKKSLKLAVKRGFDINLLQDLVIKIQHGIKLDEKYRDHGLSGKYQCK